MRHWKGPLQQFLQRWRERFLGGRRVDSEAIVREVVRIAHRERMSMPSGESYVPCRYTIALASEDWDYFSARGALPLLERQIRETLQMYIAEKGLLMNGPLQVVLTSSEELEPGSIGIDFSFASEGAPPRPEDGQVTVVTPSSGTMLCGLEVLDGPQRGQIFHLRAKDLPALIGRSSKVRVSLQHCPEHNAISREHACLCYEGGEFLIEDRSRHGTWLNGQRLPPRQPHPLRHGDEIGLASQVRLRFLVYEDEGTVVVRR